VSLKAFVFFFFCKAAHEKILTLDNLRKRRVIVVQWCCMCQRSGESIYHLLLYCEVVQELLSVIFILFRIHWVMPVRVVKLFDC